jgi:hypothetical protein
VPRIDCVDAALSPSAPRKAPASLIRWLVRPLCRRGTTLETSGREVGFELVLGDYNAMLKHVCAPASTGLWRIERLLWLAGIFIAGFSMVLFGRPGRFLLAGMIGAFSLMAVKMLLNQIRLRPLPHGAVLCRYDVQLTQSGVHVQTPNWTCDVPWHGIRAVEETAHHCFLRIDTISVYTIPKRSFASGEAMQRFIDFAHDSAARARDARKGQA